MKTHWKKAFNKDYLGSHDLDEGQELKAVIKNILVKAVKNPMGEEKSCNVAYFTDAKIKPMILNDTACKQIGRFSGSNYIEDWEGTAIQIYVQKGVKAFGEIMDALRLRDTQPRMEKPVLNKKSPKWKDAVKAYKEAENKDKQMNAMMKHYTLSNDDLALMIKEADY